MFEDGYNPLKDIFGLVGKYIDSDAQQKTQQAAFQSGVLYGVDEYGRPYYRGLASPSLVPGLATSSPIMIVGVGILAVALVVYAIKS